MSKLFLEKKKVTMLRKEAHKLSSEIAKLIKAFPNDFQRNIKSWAFFRVWSDVFQKNLIEHRAFRSRMHTKLSLAQSLTKYMDPQLQELHCDLFKAFIMVNVKSIDLINLPEGSKLYIRAKDTALNPNVGDSTGGTDKEILIFGDLTNVFIQLVAKDDLLAVWGGRFEKTGTRLFVNDGYSPPATILHFHEGIQTLAHDRFGLPLPPLNSDKYDISFCKGDAETGGICLQIFSKRPLSEEGTVDVHEAETRPVTPIDMEDQQINLINNLENLSTVRNQLNQY